MKKLIFIAVASFCLGTLVASLVFMKGETWIRGEESVVTVTRPLRLAPTGPTSGLENCTAEPQVNLLPGARVTVRKHGPVYWIEVRASIVGKDLPFEASADQGLPVLTCGKW